MKKALKLVLLFVLITVITVCGNRVYATEEGEYSVAEDSGVYSLYYSFSDGTEPIFRSNTLQGIFDFLFERGGASAVRFYGVYSEDAVVLRGDVTLLGTLSFGESCGISVYGGNVTLCDAQISLEAGTVRVMRGELSLLGGKISSDEVAVTLDYDAQACFRMSGGSVVGNSPSGAVALKSGSAYVLGGSIVSERGAAIRTSSSLCLAGAPTLVGKQYSVISDCPITLGNGEKSFTGSVDLHFEREFEKGGKYEVARAASEEELELISVSDKYGNGMRVECFEDVTLGESYASVYLPYRIDFFVGTELLCTNECLLGEGVDTPNIPKRDGYREEGWRVGSEEGELFESAFGVCADTALYASYGLLPPSFTLSSLAFEYDGSEHRLSLTIEHTRTSEGVVEYLWYKDGEETEIYSPYVPITKVSDSGTYCCRISFHVGIDVASVTTSEVEVRVEKGVIPIPKIESKFYTGAYLLPEVNPSVHYTVEYVGGIRAGVYPVVFRLTDSENYEFFGGGEVAYVNFTIQKTENFWVDGLVVHNIYTGMAPSHNACAAFGECEFLYSVSPDGPFVTTLPSSAGVYYVVARVIGTDDYTSLTSSPVSFEIILEEAVGIKIMSLPSKLSYVAFDRLDPRGMTVSATYNSGRRENVDIGLLSFIYNCGDCFHYGDGSVTVALGDVRAVLGVSVLRADYDLSGIEFSALVATYGADLKLPEVVGEVPQGIDGSAPTFTVTGGGTDVGVYTATLTFISHSNDYNTPEPITVDVTVLPLVREVVWECLTFVYDGTQKTPIAYYTDVFDRRIDLTVSGGRTYAGEYSAAALCVDPNYELSSEVASFRVLKADYDLSGAIWSTTGFVYDGEEHTVSVSGLPLGVSVLGYSDNAARDAGFYTARATLSYDTANYNPPPTLLCSWRIERAPYPDVSSLFADSSFVYDGLVHYPTLNGEMPIGYDGIRLEYSFSDGALNVSEGRRGVRISFSTSSKNYTVPSEIIRYCEITPMPVYVTWIGLDTVYDGTYKLPFAACEQCEVTVSGGGRDAGKYAVYAIPTSSNYAVINSKSQITVEQAENVWIITPTATDVYFGRMPSVSASALAGEVYFKYYLDSELEHGIDIPRELGEYYAVAVSDGDKNHKSIISSPMRFSVLEVLPIGIRVELLSPPLANKPLNSGDILAFLLNNDGSESSVSPELLTVSYESGDAPRINDGSISFSYLGFRSTVPVEVGKNTLDLSGAVWEGIVHVYDGEKKYALLSNLPSGVSVKEYVGNGVSAVGEYSIIAILAYDETSYHTPDMPKTVLKIDKSQVPTPTLENLIYNGKKQSPFIPESPFYFVDFIEEGESVGEYTVRLSLYDQKSYAFSTGESAELTFRIEKRKITVAVNDATLYLFSREDKLAPGYVITEGELAEGELLNAEYVIRDSEIYLFSKNGNYDITVIPGELERVDKLSPEMRILSIVIFTVLLIALFVVLFLYLYRDRIAAFYAARLGSYADGDVEEEEDYGLPVITEYPTEEPVSEEESNETLEESTADSECEPEGSIVNVEYADSVITDSIAKSLIRRDERVVTEGKRRRIVNVDTISRSFSAGDRVDVNSLKAHSLIPYDTAYIKVLARGIIDKPLSVYANDFSLSAVKMIALAGGKAVRVDTAVSDKKFKKSIEKRQE